MRLKKTCESYGHVIECSTDVLNNKVTDKLTMFEAIQTFTDKNKKRSVMTWVTKASSCWDNSRIHSDDDYLTCDGDVVTGTTLGESAYRIFDNKESSLVSFSPSSWLYSPINVAYIYGDGTLSELLLVKNHWEEEGLSNYLDGIQAPIQSWETLERRMRQECKHLTFTEDAFSPLQSQPFVSGASTRIATLLNVLDKYAQCFDKDGKRTDKGDEIYNVYFKGDRARFSDSSGGEKTQFENELSFTLSNGNKELCPWHGKIQTPQLRIHFAWPDQKGASINIVYIGSKITKR